MNDKEITLKVGSEFDGKGTADAKKALDGLGPAAQGAAGKSLQGFGKVREGLTSVSQGVRTLNQLVAGFGFIGALTKVASFVSSITQHFKDARVQTCSPIEASTHRARRNHSRRVSARLHVAAP